MLMTYTTDGVAVVVYESARYFLCSMSRERYFHWLMLYSWCADKNGDFPIGHATDSDGPERVNKKK